MSDRKDRITEHFDGRLHPDEYSPDGYARVDGVTVFVNPHEGTLVLTGEPNATHNCDARGCGTLDHKIAEFPVNPAAFHEVTE